MVATQIDLARRRLQELTGRVDTGSQAVAPGETSMGAAVGRRDGFSPFAKAVDCGAHVWLALKASAALEGV